MSTLIESLKRQIVRMEAEHGSDDPYVRRLKEQLRATEETVDMTAQDVYRVQLTQFSSSEDEQLETEEDGYRAEALRRAHVRRLVASKSVNPANE